jgi:hypothetical protein
VPLKTRSKRNNKILQETDKYIERLDPRTTLLGLMHQYEIQLERLEPGRTSAGRAVRILAFRAIQAMVLLLWHTPLADRVVAEGPRVP